MMTGSEEKSDFDDLSDEQVLGIFEYLPPDSFLGDMRVQLISQRFNRLVSDPSLQYKRSHSALIDSCNTDEDVIRILSNESIAQDLYHEDFLEILSVHSTLPLKDELLQRLDKRYLPTLAAYNPKIAEHILKTPTLLNKLDGQHLSRLSGGDEELIRQITLQYLGYLERDLTSRQTEEVPELAWVLQGEDYQRGRNSEYSCFWESVTGADLCSLVKNCPPATGFVLCIKILLDKLDGYDFAFLGNSPDNINRISSLIRQSGMGVGKKIVESYDGRNGDFLSQLLQREDIGKLRRMLTAEVTQDAFTGNNLVTLSKQSSDIASYILDVKVLRGKLTFCNLIDLYLQHADICYQVIAPELEKISTGTENEPLCLGYLLRGSFFASRIPSIMGLPVAPYEYGGPFHKCDFHDANLGKIDVALVGYMFEKLKNRLIEVKDSLHPIRMQHWQNDNPSQYSATYDFSEATQRSEKATQCVIWLYGLSYLYPEVAENIVRDPELREIFEEQEILSRISGFHEEVANLVLKTPAYRQEFNGDDLIRLGECHISIARKILSDQALVEESQERLSIFVSLSQRHPKLVEEYNLLSDKEFFDQLTSRDLRTLVAEGTINVVRHCIENKEEWKRKFSESPLFLSNLTYTVISKIAEERWDFYQRVTFSAQALKAAAEGAIKVQEESSVRGLLQKLNEILAPVPSSPENLQASSSRSLVEQFSACRVRGEDESGFTSAALQEKEGTRNKKSLSL